VDPEPNALQRTAPVPITPSKATSSQRRALSLTSLPRIEQIQNAVPCRAGREPRNTLSLSCRYAVDHWHPAPDTANPTMPIGQQGAETNIKAMKGPRALTANRRAAQRGAERQSEKYECVQLRGLIKQAQRSVDKRAGFQKPLRSWNGATTSPPMF